MTLNRGQQVLMATVMMLSSMYAVAWLLLNYGVWPCRAWLWFGILVGALPPDRSLVNMMVGSICWPWFLLAMWMKRRRKNAPRR